MRSLGQISTASIALSRTRSLQQGADSNTRGPRHSPVVVHDGDDDGDALDVLVGDVEHQRLVVRRVQRVLLDGRLPLF